MACYLAAQEIDDIVRAAIASGLPVRARALLFRDVAPTFFMTLAIDPVPLDQFKLDVAKLNCVERLEDGTVPLEIYLRNASDLTMGLPQARIFQSYMNVTGNRASGVPALAAATALPLAVTTKEAVIHRDDTVALQFLSGGLAASKAVAKLRVPRFDAGVQRMVNGAPWVFNGTGWLLSPSLMITNHHVINSRPDGEPVASGADFAKQAAHATAIFDYDSENAATVEVAVSKVEAADDQLDYCVLRLSADQPRPAPPLVDAPVVVTATTILPLNVIQHPHGKAKRFAFRNNLAVDADDDVVRYYTDTDSGSSGSPVFDDRWRVVALHRGAMLHAAKFQGKDTAFVNVGSQMSQVVAHLKTVAPALCAELGL